MDAPQVLAEMPPRNEAPSATTMDDLLEEVLPIIVSFLPAHEAVRTCVLARRWRHVWTFAPAFRITAVRGFGSARFNHFVDRLLSLRRQGPCPLESCEFDMVEREFDFDWNLSAVHVFLSLQSALDCNVQYLCCRFTPTHFNDFAEDLPDPAVPLISQHIQRLELSFVRVALDFSACPSLVDLRMEQCVTRAINMVSASLKHLSMNWCVLDMRHRTSISLPNLVRLEFTDCFGKLPLFESLPSLETAIVRLGDFPGDKCVSSEDSVCLNDNPCWECRFAFEFDTDRRRSYFFQGLSQATHLELSAGYDQAFILQRDLKYRTTFPMLKTLVLDDWCLDADLSALIHFIQHSPNLEKLSLELVEEFDSLMVTDGSNHPVVGASSSDHLNMVEIKCAKFDGRINKVSKILISCGVSPEKISIQETDASP